MPDDLEPPWDEDQDEPEVFDRPIQRFIGVEAFTIGLANKRYGGPEEGGWWYDTFEPYRVFYISSRSLHPDRIHRKLDAWCVRMNLEEKRYPPGSVLCRGFWTVVREAITTDQPEERQYYS